MFSQSYCVFLFVTQSISYTIEVKSKQGKIIGNREETVFNRRTYYAFYGVPYAKPPVGKLRFKDPESPEKWEDTLDATVDYRGACAQAHIVHKHALHGVEDCLYMNIYTPDIPKHPNTELKSVLLYIHGYAFASSLSHIYGSDFFIDKDVIFVTVTHRIGVFGFLKADDTTPDINMGLKDIVMALKWTRNNIKHFGGNKTRITVMGSDSGATFLSLLLMTKHRKLIPKVILQSGAIFSPSLFQSDYKVERERLKQNLRKMGFKDIFAAPAKDIIAASLKIYDSKEFINFQKPVVPFTPILESKSNESLLNNHPDVFYGKQMGENIKIQILIGFNSRESISEVIPFIHNPHYLKYFEPYFKFMIPFSDGCVFNYTSNSYKKVADVIKNHYFKNGIGENSLDDFIQYTTDLKIYPIWKFIQAHLNIVSNKMYVYKFNHIGAFNAAKSTSIAGVKIKVKGACNGDELCYLLKCEPLSESYAKILNDTKSRDRTFITEITSLWANFVKTGNPSSDSKTRDVWQPMTKKQNKLLLLGKVTTLVDSKTENDMFLFWNGIYEKLYSRINCNKKAHEEL